MEDFETLLRGSAESHGHLCPGQVVGVRMAILGCRLLGINDPKTPGQIKKIIIYVEIDRCATDAIAYVTGVKLGRRSLKFMNYGIMAATFVNLETGKAYRVASTEESRDLGDSYAPEITGKSQQQLEAYKRMPDSVLFRVQEVRVSIGESDLPGPTRYKAVCSRCGQIVRDQREVVIKDAPVCRPCAGGAYFGSAREINLSDVSLAPTSREINLMEESVVDQVEYRRVEWIR